MSDEVRCYDVHGLNLRVAAGEPSLIRPVDSLLGVFLCADAREASAALTIRHADEAGQPAPEADPDGLNLRSRCVLPDGLVMYYYVRPGRRRIVIEGRASLNADLAGRRVDLAVRRGEEWCIVHACLIPMLVELLAQVGQNAVHAACLAMSLGGGYRSVLVSGASGMGKTTTTLALARGGMEFLADDTTFVIESPGGELAVWGLRLPCKVRPRTLELLPWLMTLERHPASVQGEWIVDTHALWPPRRITAQPVAVLFIGERNDRQHVLTPLDKVSAVAQLTNENVRAVDPSAQGPAGTAFRTFARLIGRCPTYRLSVGADLPSLFDTVAPLLRG
jgi:hypothetical protein